MSKSVSLPFLEGRALLQVRIYSKTRRSFFLEILNTEWNSPLRVEKGLSPPLPPPPPPPQNLGSPSITRNAKALCRRHAIWSVPTNTSYTKKNIRKNCFLVAFLYKTQIPNKLLSQEFLNSSANSRLIQKTYLSLIVFIILKRGSQQSKANMKM